MTLPMARNSALHQRLQDAAQNFTKVKIIRKIRKYLPTYNEVSAFPIHKDKNAFAS